MRERDRKQETRQDTFFLLVRGLPA